MRHAQSPGHGQGVHLQPADEHGIGAQGQGLEGVLAAPHAAVEQQRVVRANGGAYRGQVRERGRRAVQAAPAVVGDDQAGNARGLQLARIPCTDAGQKEE